MTSSRQLLLNPIIKGMGMQHWCTLSQKKLEVRGRLLVYGSHDLSTRMLDRGPSAHATRRRLCSLFFLAHQAIHCKTASSKRLQQYEAARNPHICHEMRPHMCVIVPEWQAAHSFSISPEAVELESH